MTILAKKLKQSPLEYKMIALGLIVIVFLVFHIWFRTNVITMGYELSRLESHSKKLEAEVTSLKFKKNYLKSPSNLQKISQRLKKKGIAFHRPKAAQVIYHYPK